LRLGTNAKRLTGDHAKQEVSESRGPLSDENNIESSKPVPFVFDPDQ
jgi:hypothetical protein